jgi:hypothetical protein
MLGLRREDVPTAIEGEGVELRKQRLGTMTVAFVRAHGSAAGFLMTCVKCPHWGYVLKGKVRMHTNAGHYDYEAGQAFYWAPGTRRR